MGVLEWGTLRGSITLESAPAKEVSRRGALHSEAPLCTLRGSITLASVAASMPPPQSRETGTQTASVASPRGSVAQLLRGSITQVTQWHADLPPPAPAIQNSPMHNTTLFIPSWRTEEVVLTGCVPKSSAYLATQRRVLESAGTPCSRYGSASSTNTSEDRR